MDDTPLTLVVRRLLPASRERVFAMWLDPDSLKRTDQQPTEVTIELFDRGGQTELVLTHRGLPPAKVGDHTRGWTEIVRKLEVELTA